MSGDKRPDAILVRLAEVARAAYRRNTGQGTAEPQLADLYRNSREAGEAPAARSLIGTADWPAWCLEYVGIHPAQAELCLVFAENGDRIDRTAD